MNETSTTNAPGAPAAKRRVKLERLAVLMNEGQHTGATLPWLDDLDVEDEPIQFLFHRKVEGKDHGAIAEANLHTVKGIEKAGKSALGLLLIVAAIRGEFLGVEASRSPIKILWIDTEQDRRTLRQKARAVLRMAGVSKRPDTLRILTLRGESVPDRMAFTQQAIREEAPDLVILDGVVDLCEEFNDERASRAVVNELAALSEKNGVAILNVIHTNRKKESIDDALKARGHLGTLMQQKSAEIYQVDNLAGVAKVTLEKSRFAPAPPLEFEFADNFELKGVEDHKKLAQLEKALRLAEIFEGVFSAAPKDGRGAARYTDLWKGYAAQESCQESKAKTAVKEALALGALERIGEGINTRYYLKIRSWNAATGTWELIDPKGVAG